MIWVTLTHRQHIRYMELNLVKIDQTEHSTVSQLWINGKPICFVIEDGEHKNKIYGSTRIPGGRYKMVKDYTTKFVYDWGYCWHILDVPGFSEIKIHKGNKITHTDGCLLPNLYIGFDGLNYFGVNSKAAYNRMMRVLEDSDQHHIDIIR